MPSASILARTVNWIKYYKHVLRPIAGFTKSKNDPIAVRGFRIKKQQDGTTDVTWKTDPALEKEWRGAGGFERSAGFYLLKSVPEGVPDFVVPAELSDEALKMTKKLQSANMKRVLESQGLEKCGDWVYKAATTGVIPIHRYLEDTAPRPEWGRLCEVGAVEGKRGQMREITDYWDMTLPQTRKTMWSLPLCPNNSHLDATTNHFHYSGDAALLEGRRLPGIRYKDESRKNCELANHPNNVDGGWVPDIAEEPVNEDDAPDAEADRENNDNLNENTETDDDNDDAEKHPGEHNLAEDAGGSGSEEEDGENNDGDYVPDHEKEDDSSSASASDTGPELPPPVNQQPAMIERFEEDFQGCKPGNYCVGLAQTAHGPSPYIYLGQIKTVDQKARKFMYKPLRSTTDSWLPACVNKKWHPAPGKADLVETHHYGVMSYFKKMNSNNKIPKAAQRSVDSRTNIVWYKKTWSV